MKKFSKLIILSLTVSLGMAAGITPKAQAEISGSKVENKNDNFNYPFSLSDHFRTLERYASSISKFSSNSRWKYVPENLVMVYLWNKDYFNEEGLPEFAEKWVNLSEKEFNGPNSESARITNIFANLLRQNFTEAEKSYRKLNKEQEPFWAEVAKTLIGESKKTQASLQGNTFIYDIRVVNLDQARQLANNWPESSLARYILAMTLKNKEDQSAGNEDRTAVYSEALPEISKAEELAPNNLLYSLKKIQLAYDEKNPAITDNQFKALFNKSLKDSYIAEEIAIFYAHNKQIAQSIDYLTGALNADKSKLSLLRKLNSLYTYTGYLPPIISLYEKAISENPEKIELYEDLAELYQKNKSSNKDIINLFKKAVAANPQNSDMFISLGDAFFYDKDPEDAAAAYQKAISINNNNPEAYGKLIGIYWDKNDTDDVIKYANEAIKNTPDYSMGYLWLGSVYLKQNKNDEAVRVIKESIRLNPKFITGYNSLGLAYRAAKKYDLAVEQFRKALEINPSYLEALLNIGDTYTQKGDYALAENTYKQALTSDPYNEGIYFSLGNLYTESKDFKNAESAFQKAILLNPNSLDARNNLGNVFLKQNKLDEAINEFEKVLDINNNYATAYYNIACALSLKNSREDSLKFLARAIQMDNTLKEVARTDSDFNNIKSDSKFRELTE
jgi:tetratricopeptide (TPR) repeat protein